MTDNMTPTPGTYGDLEAWIEFQPAYYCMGKAIACRWCDAGRKDNHGRHGVDMRWYLRGPDAAAQFVVFTGWHHPADPFAQNKWGKPHRGGDVTPADIGFHSVDPWYDGMDILTDNCDLLGGRPCYYDGSGLRADEGWQLLLSGGSEAVWAWLAGEFSYWVNERAEYRRRVVA